MISLRRTFCAGVPVSKVSKSLQLLEFLFAKIIFVLLIGLNFKLAVIKLFKPLKLLAKPNTGNDITRLAVHVAS